MKKIVIKRTKQDLIQTTGILELFIDGKVVFTCFTLELPWMNNERRISRIPESKYKAIPHQSPKFGNSIWIQDVPNRSEILIHYGNFFRNTLGCILVGRDLFDIDGDGHLDVTASKKTINQLYNYIKDEKKIEVEIQNFAPSKQGTI